MDLNNIKQNFDYGSINEDHKNVIQEIIHLAKETNNHLFADFISYKFKIKEENKFDLKNSSFFKFCEKNNIHLNIQGYVQDGTNPDSVHYPVVSIIEDIRKLDDVFKK
jgi:hypothetical protein